MNDVDDPADPRRDPPAWRIATAHRRRLPDFIIIGTQRGGTTSLYRYLSEHPEIGAALRKEVHYFDRYYDKGLDWYLAHFPEAGQAPVVGEASPYYLFHPAVPERVRAAIPRGKFIALLRNPVDRAYSQYQMKVRHGFESLSFEEAIAAERERLSSSDDPLSSAWRHHYYLGRGLYLDQLQRWLTVFPREQLLIVKSEEMFEEPGRIVQQTLAFLGLPPRSSRRYKAFHLAEYAAMNPATRRRLRDYFAPHNRQLYALLDHDFGWDDE
jgi:hypothetical protein